MSEVPTHDIFGRQLYWRCEVSNYWDGKHDNDGSFEHLRLCENIRFARFSVEKTTPRGVRLCNGKFVAHHWLKKYAYPTQADALQSFIARRRRYVAILTAQLDRAKDELRLAERFKFNDQPYEVPAVIELSNPS